MLSLKRRYTNIKSGQTSEDTRHFITSLEEQQRSPKELARIIRVHWSVENKKPLALRHLSLERRQHLNTQP
jgi:predicted transposase YbfD/YdcC